MHLKRYSGQWYKSLGDRLQDTEGNYYKFKNKPEKELECRDDIIDYLNKLEGIRNERTATI